MRFLDAGHEVSVIKGSPWREHRQSTTQGEEMRELSEERRNKWISAISREDLTDSILEHGRVCGKHFISGQAAKLWERYDPDWVPTQSLGHKKCDSGEKLQNLEAAAKGDERARDRELK